MNSTPRLNWPRELPGHTTCKETPRGGGGERSAEGDPKPPPPPPPVLWIGRSSRYKESNVENKRALVLSQHIRIRRCRAAPPAGLRRPSSSPFQVKCCCCWTSSFPILFGCPPGPSSSSAAIFLLLTSLRVDSRTC